MGYVHHLHHHQHKDEPGGGFLIVHQNITLHWEHTHSHWQAIEKWKLWRMWRTPLRSRWIEMMRRMDLSNRWWKYRLEHGGGGQNIYYVNYVGWYQRRDHCRCHLRGFWGRRNLGEKTSAGGGRNGRPTDRWIPARGWTAGFPRSPGLCCWWRRRRVRLPIESTCDYSYSLQ